MATGRAPQQGKEIGVVRSTPTGTVWTTKKEARIACEKYGGGIRRVLDGLVGARQSSKEAPTFDWRRSRMSHSVFQRFAWDGQPREVAVWWTLRRGSGPQQAICRMFTHQFGHELRLEVKGQLVESQVCRTDDDVLDQQERWRSGLEAKGWTK